MGHQPMQAQVQLTSVSARHTGVAASLSRALQCAPGKRRQQVTPDMTAEMRWLRSPKVGVVSLSVRKQMSYSASLSSTMHSSAFSTSWCTDSVALYGSTTVSDTCVGARLLYSSHAPSGCTGRQSRLQLFRHIQ